ncbi:MAG TPA: BTAD domain-containing putative transcriptional regulator [Streptosporangiaceae bacterium]|nr:BTAD domain-containing putative transcriptional regulator [Streptosporangiaceae bacterium]
MTAAMEFSLLGPLAVRRGGLPVAVASGRQQALLAALLLSSGQVVPVAELTEVLWGAAPPRWAKSSLQNYVMRLRRSLTDADPGSLADAGQGRITTWPDGYLINVRRGELDVDDFQALLPDARAATRVCAWPEASALFRRAISLWRGQPLSGISSDVLALREIPRLAEMRLQALEGRIEADLHLGRHAEAIAELEQLAAAHPLRERFHALLMLAFYQDGQQARALAVYQSVRRELVRELGVEPGSELCVLQQHILSGEPADAVLDAAASAGRASAALTPAREQPAAPAPRQLPYPPGTFTGRAAELAALDSLLTGSSRPMCAITGTAGVGKTALAVHWAHHVAHQFPDGQLYADLRGYDPGQPVPAADALAGFLRALGVAGQDIPAEADERSARYRSLLAGRRMLVLLDNAGEVEQVRPLLPGTAGCVAVVTSRDALSGLVARDGATRLELDLLPPEEASGLLRALIGERAAADPAATAALAQRCCRLPLALRVAAELAAVRPATTLAALVSELSDLQRRLDLLAADGDPRTAVRAVFSWSCRSLDLAAVRAFRLAGLHPGPDLDSYAVAALTGSTAELAGAVLDRLARAHLIQVRAPGRYGMHDLLRGYARELAVRDDGPDGQRAALTCLFDYYLSAVAAATDTLLPVAQDRPRMALPAAHIPPLADPVAARAWLDAERDSLVAVTVHTAACGWPGHATRLAAALSRYLNVGGYVPEAITIQTCARGAARESRDLAAEANALKALGVAAIRQGRGRQAIGHLHQALGLYREAGDRLGEAHALNDLGGLDWRQARYPRAYGYLSQALALYRATGFRSGEANALGNLGVVDERLGRFSRAADYQEQAFVLFSQIDDRNGQARTLANLGVVELRQGMLPEAADHLRQALDPYRETGDRIGEAYALVRLGIAELRQGRFQQAASYLDQAVSVFRETGDLAGEAEGLNGLGEAAMATGQPGDARTQYGAALGLAVQAGDGYQQAHAQQGLGDAFRAAGDPRQAQRHWREALTLYASLGTPEADGVRAQLAAVHATMLHLGSQARRLAIARAHDGVPAIDGVRAR